MNSMVWSRNNNQLDSFFKPRSVAVLGASADIEKTGGRTLANLLSSGYAGKVYPINPRGGEIQGLKTYSALGEVGAPIDLVINCLPGTQFDDVVTTAIELKVKAMITFASGFAEQSHEGLLRQEAIIKRLRDGGVSLVGPNCLGVLDGVNGLAASSSVFLRELDVVAGGLSMATMSGALGVYWLDEVLRAGLGVSKWVATGNEGDVTLSDVLNYLVDDTDTKVICLYVEGIKLGHDFRTGLYRAAAANKPVIVLRSGRSSVGAKAIASHTGALAGEDVLYRTLFEQSGVCQVDSLSEMVDVARIFVTQNVAPKRKAAIISISGGAAALAADALSAQGFEIPPLSEALTSDLASFFPDYIHPGNPVDLADATIQDPHVLRRTLEAIQRDKTIDAVTVFVAGRTPNTNAYAETFVNWIPQWEGLHCIIWKGASEENTKRLKAAGVAIFDEITDAAEALGRAVNVVDKWQNASPPPSQSTFGRAGAVTQYTEYESKALLETSAGLAKPEGRLLRDDAETAAFIAETSGPYVAKLQSPSMLHKSGAGGIELGLKSGDDINTAVRRMMAHELSDIQGVLVEQMVPIAMEFFVGLQRDSTFGPFLVVGLGGTAVEVDADIARAFLPLNAAAIKELLLSLRAAPLMTGFRGRDPIPLDELASKIENICTFFLERSDLREIEINPLVVTRAGKIVMLDALVSVWDHASN